MGVVRKQSIINSILYYLGIGLGFINSIFFLTKILGDAQYGLIQVIPKVGTLFSVIAILGTQNMLLRYFPHLKNRAKQHFGFFGFIMLYMGIGIVISAAMLYLFKPMIIEHFETKDSILVNYYDYILLVGITMALFEVLSSMSRVLLKSTYPVMVREFILRVFTFALCIALYFELINFSPFFILFLLNYGLGVILLVFYLARQRDWVLGKFWQHWDVLPVKKMTIFGGYTLLNNSMSKVIRTTDVAMLSWFTTLGQAGAYGFGAIFMEVIVAPSQALRQIAAPVLANAFKENDYDQIRSLYLKTSINQLVAGLFIYGLIVLGIVDLMSFLRPNFHQAIPVIVILGAGKILELSTGINNRIIIESDRYKMSSVFTLILFLMVIVTNYLLIPPYGIVGAAVATGISLGTVGFIRVIFVYRLIGIMPFNLDTIKIFGIAAVSFLLVYFIPIELYWVLAIAIKSILFSVIYLPLVYYLKVSADINLILHQSIDRFIRRK